MMIVPLEDHPREEVFTAYVSDTLDEGAIEPFEQHVFGCARCAARLQEHACFQELLHEAATTVQVPMPEPTAASLPIAATDTRAGSRLGRRVGMLGGAWAAAAAITLVVCQHGQIEPELAPAATATAATVIDGAPASEATGPSAPSWSRPMSDWTSDWTSECPPESPDCGSSLDGVTSAWLTSLASAEPLQSIDPLSSWPDDPYAGLTYDLTSGLTGLSGREVSLPIDGEPCGSGEDGGPLVCDTELASFSG